MTRLSNFRLIDLFYHAIEAWPRFYEGIIGLFSFGQWEKWQNRVFEDLSGKKILEIGVGPGKLLARMAKKGFSVTGIELKPGMADEARRKVKSTGFDVDILTQQIHKLPFKNDVFDCIVLTFILAEIVNLDAAILEMRRILKKGGKVIVIAGGVPQDNNLVAGILFSLIRSQTVLHLERNNVSYFSKYGFAVKRDDFGPFNTVNKIVAVKQ